MWYVARRLCGNPGGYVALALYCFSPALIQASARWHREPEIVAAFEDSCERSGATEADDVLFAICQEMKLLASAINAAPVTSIEGLRRLR